MKRIIFFIMFAFISSVFADKLQDIKDKGFLIAGVKYDFKPFGFINENGRIDGFDIDLVKYISSKLDVDVRFKQVTSTNRIKLLVNNDVDLVIASMTHKLSRDKDIDFSISYFFDGQAMLVLKNDARKDYTQYEGAKIGAINGATSGGNFKKLLPSAKMIYYNEYPQALRALKAGFLDAITTDLAWCTLQAIESRGKFKVLDDILSYEPYGIGVIENESNYLDEINEILQDSVLDGTYANIYEKWFRKLPSKLPEVWPR